MQRLINSWTNVQKNDFVIAFPPYLHRIFECTCRIRFIQTTQMTVGSLTTYTAAPERGSTSAPLPKGAGGAKDARICRPVRTGTRQEPAVTPGASACNPVHLPAWERRALATSIGRGILNPGTPPTSSCSSPGARTRVSTAAGARPLWIRLGVNAPQWP